MSPEELKLIVDSAIKEGLLFPWWQYLLAIIMAFIGGFLGAYLKRKGENLAMKEGYDSLLIQIKRTTNATESIKNDLSKGSWLHQQSWYLKEKYYSGLLKELYILRASLLARLDYYMQPGAEYRDTQIIEKPHYKKQTKIGSKALKKIHVIHGPAEMVISDRAIKALNNFYSEDWHAGNFSSFNKEYLDSVYTSVDETYKIILEEAQTELKR